MVLLRVRESSLKLKEPVILDWNKLRKQSKLQLTQFLFYLNNLQSHPTGDMALPQGAFAACKLREQFQERDMIVSRLRAANADKTEYQQQRETLPMKYNDKLMNSIWGLYNRYSPHNVKKNEYAPPKC
ncbi:uncharacterized protein LOC108595421 [Drosophila busckii]|uniref:uncharacterized protein LOC108595421 n=1 Tax=Drosophila busckii TaxID=30019 RepID=UPI00083EDB32|nr:uncharacterized protein LOC108595421 [Drosophila busckii]